MEAAAEEGDGGAAVLVAARDRRHVRDVVRLRVVLVRELRAHEVDAVERDHELAVHVDEVDEGAWLGLGLGLGLGFGFGFGLGLGLGLGFGLGLGLGLG